MGQEGLERGRERRKVKRRRVERDDIGQGGKTGGGAEGTHGGLS